MKCTLEIYGNSYESTEFSDRHVFGMVASVSAGGINLKSLFERVLGDKETKESVLSKSGLDTLFSDFDFDTAEKNMASILKRVFPTFDKPLNEIDTASMVLIVSAMVNALVTSNAEPEKTIEHSITEPSIALIPVRNNPDKPLPIVEAIEPIDNTWGTEIPKIKTMEDIESFGWEYPPGEIILHSTQEESAIGYAAEVSGAEPAKVRCWYAWWQTVNEGEAVTPSVAIELIRDFTNNQFTNLECERYYALITAHLAPRAIAA